MKEYKLFDSVEAANKRIPLNTTVRVDAEGLKVCVGKNVNGFFAIADACPHLGASLSQGKLNNNNQIVCPWHSYRFNLINGEECDRRAQDLSIFKIEIKENGVYLILS